jgi:hypothetical protein
MPPSFSHQEGPEVAAETMANHLRGIFAGNNLLPTRQPMAIPPSVPHAIDEDLPFSKNSVEVHLCDCKSRRKAPGSDHLRAEMLVPIKVSLVPVLSSLLFKLCWR